MDAQIVVKKVRAYADLYDLKPKGIVSIEDLFAIVAEHISSREDI